MNHGVGQWRALLKRRRWGMAVTVVAFLVAMVAVAVDGAAQLTEDEVDEKVAQATLNPMPPLGGPGSFGVAAASQVTLGSLKPSYSNTDMKVSAPFGGFSLRRSYTGANNAWLEGPPARRLGSPFGHVAATGAQTGAALQWWHGLHSFIVLRVNTVSDCTGSGDNRICEDAKYWDVYGGPAGTKNSFRQCETDGCFASNDSEQVLKVQLDGNGLVVHAPDGRYHYRDFRPMHILKDLPVGSQKIIWSGAYFLSYVEPPQYDESACAFEFGEDAGVDVAASCHRRSVRLTYQVPTQECPLPTDGSASTTLGADFPVLASATAANGARLVFHYKPLDSRVPELLDGFTRECVLDSVDLVGRGGTVEQGVVKYSYLDDKAGLLTRADWPDRDGGAVTGTVLDYAYQAADGTRLWEVKRDGVLVVRQRLADGGSGNHYVAHDQNEHEGQSVSVEDNGCAPGRFFCEPSQHQTFTTLTPTVGDGTGTPVSSVRRTFGMQLSGEEPDGDQGPLLRTAHTMAFCGVGCLGVEPGGVRSEWDWTSVKPPQRVGKVEMPVSELHPNGSYTVYQAEVSSNPVVAQAGYMPPAELKRVLLGAESADGGVPLLERKYTYVYGTGGRLRPFYPREQLVDTESSASTFSDEDVTLEAKVRRQYDPATNRLTAVVRSGYSWEFANRSWHRVPRSVGTFYLTEDACGGPGTADPKGRVRTVMGPCAVLGTGSTSCNNGGAIPLTVYDYWEDTTPDDRAGRLKRKRVYPDGCGSNPIQTFFDAYDSRGRLLREMDPNGVVTAYEYEGERLTKVTAAVATPLETVTEYGYDDNATHGDYIKDHQGRYEVLCFRKNTPPGTRCRGGDPSRPLTDLLQWKASSGNPDGSNPSERVDYTYYQGKLRSETYRDASGQVRRTRYYEGDPLGRQTFESWGAAGPSPSLSAVFSQTGLFDGQGNRVGLGLPYQPDAQAPAPLCGGFESSSLATGMPRQPSSPQCKAFAYDRLNRLVSLMEPTDTTSNSGAAVRTVLTYDAAGNLKTVQQGCSRSGPCGQPVIEYKHDDFGNLVRVKAPWAMGPQEVSEGPPGRGLYHYGYDAQGNLVHKQTPAMASAAEPQWLKYSYDSLGRMLKAEAVRYADGTDQHETLFTYFYDQQAPTPWGCPGSSSSRPSRSMGRAQVLTDSFGDTWYQYDVHGRVISMYRVRARPQFAARTEICNSGYTPASPNRFFYYDHTGRLRTEQLPGGRGINYTYYDAATGNSHRVRSVFVSLWDGTTWNQSHTVVEDVRWEPFGGLRSYVLVAPKAPAGAQKARVEYHTDGSNLPLPSCDSTAFVGGTDTSGRLFGLTVSKLEAGGALGDIFKRAYTWKADQLLQEDTCVLETGNVAPGSVRYADGTTEAPGYDARLQLRRAHRPSAASVSAGGAFSSRAYEYDARGNRTLDVQDDWQYSNEYDGSPPRVDWLTARSLDGRRPVSTQTTVVPPRFSVTQRYGYDANGRVQQVAGYKKKADNPDSPFHTLTLDASTNGANAAVGSVYRQVTDSEGRSYEYFYDAFGRRRLKRYLLDVPAGAPEDEFFYDGTRLLEDWGHTGFDLATADSVRDEYIWLDNRPIAFFKVRASLSGQRVQDFLGECPRNGEPAPCGLYFLVTDGLGKPVLAMDSFRRVAGVGDYDPYGHVNRTTQVADSPELAPGQNALMARFQAPTSAALTTQLRARLSFLDVHGGSGVYLADSSGTLVNDVDGTSTLLTNKMNHEPTTAWAQVGSDGSLQLRFQAAFDSSSVQEAALAGFEYRRFQVGAAPVWTPLRFAGQYHDTETDLFENWNRYYAAESGRYFAADSLLFEPTAVLESVRSGQGASAYTYANGNPVGNTDPDGRVAILLPFAVAEGAAWFAGGAASASAGAWCGANDCIRKAVDAIKAVFKSGDDAEDTKNEPEPSAEDRAQEIHDAVPEVTKDKTTVAVTETEEGVRIVSSSERRLRRSQRELLQEGEVEGVGAGHAEVTGLNTARELGLTPTGVAASRPICTGCAGTLAAEGVKPLSPLKN